MADVKMVALIGNGEIRFSDLKEKLGAVRRLYPDAMWISNGTIGADLMIAKYAMLNKIPLFMCIPFLPEIISAKWVRGWQDILSEALEYAQKVSVSSDVFSLKGYQKCNKYIIDHADVVVVFARSISEDISDCTRYAKSSGKLVLDGFSLSIPYMAEFHGGSWNYPITRVIAADGIVTSCGEGVYGDGVALPIQNINPFETVVTIGEDIV